MRPRRLRKDSRLVLAIPAGEPTRYRWKEIDPGVRATNRRLAMVQPKSAIPERTPMRILLVEDQTILRELLIARLRTEYPSCEVTEAADLAALGLIAAAKPRFDLWIFDLELPDGNALEWIENWAKEQSSPRAIVLSSSNEDRVLFRVLHSNLPAFVHKDDGIDMLQLAIKTVLAGGIFLSPSVHRLRSKMQADPVFFDRILTKTEQEILTLLGQGLSNEEIAQALGIREQTAGVHRKHIMNKLDLHTQADLIRYAIKKGFSKV
jgi:two-component system, NarL family, response regulator NreC